MELRLYPDLSLRQSRRKMPWDDIPAHRENMEAMAQLMEASGGVGLAANQVGYPYRVIVVDLDGALVTMINPKITKICETKIVQYEGCLSFPGVLAKVYRSKWIKVQWWDMTGIQHTASFDNQPARIIQHECDHLDGKLFLDYAIPSLP